MKSVPLGIVLALAGTVLSSSSGWISALNGDEPTTCARTRCGVKGDECGLDGRTIMACVPPYVCCRSDPKKTTGTCSIALAIGSSCTDSSECNTGDLTVFDRFCSSAGKCQETKKLGQPCSETAVCDQGLKCTEGFCQNATAPEGQGCGANTSATCCPGTYCDPTTFVCTRFRQKGEACSAMVSCDVGMSCVEGNCTTHFTAAEGKPCSEKSCAPPLVCSNSGKCTKSESVKRRECETFADCKSDVAECICDSASGKRICVAKLPPSDQSIKLYREAIRCIRSAGYDERPCYPKTLQWMESKLSERVIVPEPELYCLFGDASVPGVATTFILALVTAVSVALL